MKILLGTKNKHKIIEMKRILLDKLKDEDLEIISLNDVEDVIEPIEDGKSFSKNALIKAKYYYELFKIPTIADDSGVSVDALNGEPGIFSARYASTNNENSSNKANRDKLLEVMKDVTNRSAYYTCAIAYYSSNNEIITEGYSYGKILYEEIGENGFGYDIIFYSNELDKPLGLATEDEKDSISHRAKAINKLVDVLNEQKSTKL